MRRLLLLACVLTQLLACDDPTGVEGVEDESFSAQFWIRVEFVDSSVIDQKGSRIDIGASVFPGRTEEGKPRRILEDTLRVLGRTLTPIEVSANGKLKYKLVIPTDAADFASKVVVLTAPSIEGVQPLFPGLRWRPFGRPGPDVLSVSGGEDVLLPLITPVAVSTPVPDEEVWTVALTAGDTITRIKVEGMPPEEVLIPVELLPKTDGSPLEVSLDSWQSRSDETLREGDYVVTPSVQVTLYWHVFVAGP